MPLPDDFCVCGLESETEEAPNKPPSDGFCVCGSESETEEDPNELSLDDLDVEASGLKPEEDPNKPPANGLGVVAFDSCPEEGPNRLPPNGLCVDARELKSVAGSWQSLAVLPEFTRGGPGARNLSRKGCACWLCTGSPASGIELALGAAAFISSTELGGFLSVLRLPASGEPLGIPFRLLTARSVAFSVRLEYAMVNQRRCESKRGQSTYMSPCACTSYRSE
jgi:hypothetical protein